MKQFKHPECQEGEVFLTNSSDYGSGVGWKTKRIGEIAYDKSGKVVKGLRPVFVQAAELKKAGINPRSLWD